VRRGLLALAALYLLAHLALLPPTFDDIDAINFGLGVRDFDVAQHQPHPPGYPLFIAAGKIATPLLAATHVAAPDVRGLAVWSALAGAVLVVLIFALWRQLDGDVWHAGIATAIAVCSPLFWFTSLRPLSDLSGLCAATGSLLRRCTTNIAVCPTNGTSSDGSAMSFDDTADTSASAPPIGRTTFFSAGNVIRPAAYSSSRTTVIVAMTSAGGAHRV